MAPLLRQLKRETKERIGHTRGRWDKEAGPQAESIGCGNRGCEAKERVRTLLRKLYQAVGGQEAIAEALVASDVQL